MAEQHIKKQKFPPQKEIPKTVKKQEVKNKKILFSDIKVSEKEREAIYNQYFQNLST